LIKEEETDKRSRIKEKNKNQIKEEETDQRSKTEKRIRIR
jgi:hypothetical protein